MPRLRPFRALRYASAATPRISDVLCPPYDIISGARAQELLARDAHNAIRVELPQDTPGEPDSRYRNAARALAEWRSGGILVKDRQPTLTIHEMRWTGLDGQARAARGFFTRLRLEPFSSGGGVRPHERTMTGPKEDRFKLLKATGTNLSPVILLHEAGATETARLLDRLSDRPPDVTAETEDGVSHRLWICPVEGDSSETVAGGDGGALLELVGSVPQTIADGHHRYETALRYRAERAQARACESDPAWDYVMALLYEVGHVPPVLPTHRVLLAGPAGDALLTALADLVSCERLADPAAVLAAMARRAPLSGEGATGTGRFGLVSGGVSALLHARREAIEPALDPAASAAARGLDVNLLAVMLDRLGIDAAALAAGGRLTYVKDAAEAVAMVTRGEGVAAFLLDGPPVTAVTRVAAAGEVMPQKSTYFNPKAPTGLLFGPLEW